MSSYRRHDKKRGTCPFLTSNIILFLLGVGLIGFSQYYHSLLPIHKVLADINFYYISSLYGGITLSAYGLLGIFAIFGGSLMYIFLILSILLTIVVTVLTGFTAYWTIQTLVLLLIFDK